PGSEGPESSPAFPTGGTPDSRGGRSPTRRVRLFSSSGPTPSALLPQDLRAAMSNRSGGRRGPTFWPKMAKNRPIALHQTQELVETPRWERWPRGTVGKPRLHRAGRSDGTPGAPGAEKRVWVQCKQSNCGARSRNQASTGTQGAACFLG